MGSKHNATSNMRYKEALKEREIFESNDHFCETKGKDKWFLWRFITDKVF